MNLLVVIKAFTIVSWFGIAQADLFDHHEALGMACALGAQELFTTCEREDYGCFCDSSLYVYAVENCIGKEARFNSTLMGMAFDKFNIKFCELHNSHANTTNVWSAENQEANPTVTEKAYKLAYLGERNNMSQKVVSVWLGVGLIFYWTVIVAAEFFFRLCRALMIRLFTVRIVMRRSSKPMRLLYKHVLWPALFGTQHMKRLEYFRGWVGFSFPTRFETVLVSIYIILCLVFMLTPYSLMNNDPLFGSRWKEMMRYASDRAGIIATIQFPLLFLFAMRNNILIWITGWSYSTFNTYHRAIARVTYILLLVHAVMKHIFSLSYGGSLVKYYYPVPYFRYGVAAMGLFSLMLFLAVFRARMYEIFYRLHQAMALGGLICSIYHLNGLGFKTPLWISIAFWGADWTIRACKIFLFNINFFIPPLPGARRESFATARVYDGEMIKLSITTPTRWICAPGQYVFVHFSQWSFIGGHPFSVVGVPKGIDTGLEVVIKARTGATRRLFTELDNRSCTPQYPVTIPIYVEGPYGTSAPVCDSEEGLFFAGGIGITGVLAYIEQMATSTKATLCNRKVKFFWAIRDRSDIDPFAERLVRLRHMKNIQIHIYQRGSPKALQSRGIGVDYETGKNINSGYYDEKEKPGLVNIEMTDSSSWNNEGSNKSSEPSPHVRFPFGQTYNKPTGHAAASLLPHRFSRHSKSNMDSGLQNISAQTRYHKRKHSDFRHSIAALVKARNPEEADDTYDYGREHYIEAHASNRNSAASSESSDEIHTPTSNSDPFSHSRAQYSDFINAGFTDIIEERKLSMLNPFDETIHPYTDVLGDPSAAGESQKMFIDEIYELVEPIGMDVAGLIRNNFKHSDGSICVLGCGPDRMMDTLRWSCGECQDLAKNGRVDYYEEAFRW